MSDTQIVLLAFITLATVEVGIALTLVIQQAKRGNMK